MTYEEMIEDFLKFYNYNVPNPDHQPRIFEYYVRMYRFFRGW